MLQNRRTPHPRKGEGGFIFPGSGGVGILPVRDERC